MAEEEEVNQVDYQPEEVPILPLDAQMASTLFVRESVDGILDRGIGTFHTLNVIRSLIPKIPGSCAVRDLLFLVESVGTEGDFIEETFINFFVECLGIVKHEFIGSEEDEAEEPFALTPEFIADRLSDLQPLEGAEFTFNFTSFLVQNAEITSAEAIMGFDALLTVSLKSNLISDLSPFSKLRHLKRLDLTENRVRSIGGFRFQSLETLTLQRNQIVALDQFEAPKLQKLDLSGNRIFFIGPFTFLRTPSLETLILSTNNLRVLREQCFAGLSNLKSLKLSENQLPAVFLGISKDLTSLSDLDIGDNPLQSLAGLNRLTALEVLDVHKTGVEQPMDFSPLIDHCPLKYLYIYETPLADMENVKLELIHILPLLEEIDEQAVTFSDRQESDQLFADRAAEELRMFEEMRAAAIGPLEEEDSLAIGYEEGTEEGETEILTETEAGTE
jgi:hypothetical protein